jgi:pyruvate formate lyase activating enzyme
VVFDVQSFSLQDGPGIRSTIFLKGCPLRCLWCHNPESISPRPQLMTIPNLCTDCLRCLEACPTGAHSAQQGHHQIDFAKCQTRGQCVEACLDGALTIVGETYTPASLWQRIEPDLHYWQLEAAGQSGGITFSGGEPMLRAQFIAEFARLAPGPIHLAVETSGQAPWSAFEALDGLVDLWLFDYKATGPAEHRRLTGQDDRLIMANLDRLCASGAEVILRLPIIPGLNNTDQHFAGIAAVLRRYPRISRAELLGYHTLGEAKTDRLGLPKPAYRGPSATPEQKRSWLSQLRGLGASNVVLT